MPELLSIDQDGQVLFVQAEQITNILDSCGDTFIAYFLTSLFFFYFIIGRSLTTALETGCRIAAKEIS